MNRQAVNKSVKHNSSNESSLTNTLKHKQALQNDPCIAPVATASGLARDFNAIPVRLNTAPVSIQEKLKIGDTNDKYDQEADRVVYRVMRMPEPSSYLDRFLVLLSILICLILATLVEKKF